MLGSGDENGRTSIMTDVIAFFLPQFHPIAENDAWWGKGFTEWRNVTRARPAFPGHIQPRLPAELGFYDLRVPETRNQQAELAREHGVSAFCYYHYWFNGRRLLERPVEGVLKSGEPDFPFLLCWANENWTRRWDGADHEILMAQHYSAEDDLDHIRALAPVFADPRYYRFQGKPVFLIYRTEIIPDIKATVERWRNEAVRLGLGELFLGRVESFDGETDPRSLGLDFAVEFAPRWRLTPSREFGEGIRATLRRRGLLVDGYVRNSVHSYEALMRAMLARPDAQYPLSRCACPSWDNTPRRPTGATIMHGATPELFEKWVSSLLANPTLVDGAPLPVFVNAWNEWAEGAHLEPCSVFGRGFLEALRSAVTSARPSGLDADPIVAA